MPTDRHPILLDPAELLGRPGAVEAVYRRHFEDSMAGAALVTTRGVFLRANHAFCSLTESTRTELEGRMTWQEITSGRDVEMEEAERDKVARGEEPFSVIRKSYRHKAGWDVPVVLKIMAAADGADGKPVFLVSQAQQEEPRRQGDGAAAAG